MRILVGVVAGVLLAAAAAALLGYLAIMNGWIPAAADGGELPGEEWAAKHALSAVLRRDAVYKSPLPATEDTLMSGAHIYSANCSGCHGTPKDPAPDFAKGFDPLPTLFGQGDLITDDPEGYTFWKIKHGIKFTGMPSFKYSLNDQQIWQVTMFLKNMDKLPAPVSENWKNMK